MACQGWLCPCIRHASATFLFKLHGLAGTSPDILNDFWNSAIGKLPKTGSWFPRIELAGNLSCPVLQIRIRPAPATHSTIRLIDYQNEDFRKLPRHKGPDLAKLISARKKIAGQGADEAILTTPKGFLLEGLTTSILWWEGSVLCTTPSSQRILPGVTSQLLRLIAEQENIPFAYRFRKTADLNGCEVWAVNALHGIRRVVDWENPHSRRPAISTSITGDKNWTSSANRSESCTGQTPATVISPIRIDPDFLAPRICVSAPIATICLNISFRFPAIVISSTGYWMTPFSTQNPDAPLE